MVTVRIKIDDYLAEYVYGKYYDLENECVRFPPASDIYVVLYDLLQKRPVSSPVDRGNVVLCLPCRKEGKDPETYNYLSARAQQVLNNRLKIMMWAELHEMMDENKHLRGVPFKESVYLFLSRYGIESLSEDALLKNYQRWRDKLRRKHKRGYKWRSANI